MLNLKKFQGDTSHFLSSDPDRTSLRTPHTEPTGFASAQAIIIYAWLLEA